MKYVKRILVISILLMLILLQSCRLSSRNTRKQPDNAAVASDTPKTAVDIQGDTSIRMVSLTKYLQFFATDFRYATPNNFTGRVLYQQPEAFLRVEAARRLQAVEAELAQQNLALLIFDAYRPFSVTEIMWSIVPDERYAANPAKGSGHNRGIAVDLTLIRLDSRKALPMPTDFDDFSEKAHHDYMQLSDEVIANRKLLRSIMEKHGFVALETEWWHYYLPNSGHYPILNFSFDEMRQRVMQ